MYASLSKYFFIVNTFTLCTCNLSYSVLIRFVPYNIVYTFIVLAGIASTEYTILQRPGEGGYKVCKCTELELYMLHLLLCFIDSVYR